MNSKHVAVFAFFIIIAAATEGEAFQFRLVVPEGTRVCKAFSEGMSAEEEYARLTMVWLVAGTRDLPMTPGTYPFEWVGQWLYGPNQTPATPTAPGTIQLVVTGSTSNQTYTYTLQQSLVVGRIPITARVENLWFSVVNGVPPKTEIVFDEANLSRFFWMVAEVDYGGSWPEYFRFQTCTGETWPAWRIVVLLENGGRIDLLRPHIVPMAGSGPAALVWGRAQLPVGTREVREYWRLVYAADHHNWNEKFWVIFDQPLIGGIYGVAVYHREWGEPTTAHYLNEKLQLGPALTVRSYTVIPVAVPFGLR